MKKIVSLLLTVLILTLACTAALADIHGLGIYTTIGSSKSAAEGKDGTAQVDSTICAVALDDDNKIVAISFDVAQTRVAFNDKGEVTADLTADIKSKTELADEYGMKKASPIEKEIHEQIAALEAWCIGKTADEIVTGIAAGDDADLLAGCTIKLEGYVAALAKAVMNAK